MLKCRNYFLGGLGSIFTFAGGHGSKVLLEVQVINWQLLGKLNIASFSFSHLSANIASLKSTSVVFQQKESEPAAGISRSFWHTAASRWKTVNLKCCSISKSKDWLYIFKYWNEIVASYVFGDKMGYMQLNTAKCLNYIKKTNLALALFRSICPSLLPFVPFIFCVWICLWAWPYTSVSISRHADMSVGVLPCVSVCMRCVYFP